MMSPIQTEPILTITRVMTEEACNVTKDSFNYTAALEAAEAAGDLPSLLFYQMGDKVVITRHFSGSISMIASATLMWTILRSHVGLSETFNRLLFGLCVADVISSFANMLSSIAMPKDLDYMFPSVYGNTATCSTQGFLHVVGTFSGLLYNCSICIYYLAIVKYNKKDVYIRTKIEPWMHAISTIIPLTGGIAGLAMQAMNQFGSVCTIKAYKPFHCEGCNDGTIPEGFVIPCGRGANAPMLFNILCSPILFGTPVVITITMSLMYRVVAKTERKRKSYGRGSLRIPSNGRASVQFPSNARASLRFPSNEDTNTAENSRCNPTCSNIFQWFFPCMRKQDAPTRRRRNADGKRNILFRAFAYNIAWLVTYFPFIIHRIMELAGVHKTPVAFFFVDALFLPMQGLINFIIYMYPKVMKAKSSKKFNLSWCQAFTKALMSKGDEKRRGLPPQTLLNDFRQWSSRTSLLSRSFGTKALLRRFSSIVFKSTDVQTSIKLETRQNMNWTRNGDEEKNGVGCESSSHDELADERESTDENKASGRPSLLNKLVRFDENQTNILHEEVEDSANQTSEETFTEDAQIESRTEET